MTRKKKNLLDNLEGSGDIMHCFKLGNHIKEYGKTNGKMNLVHHWHLLGGEKKVQDEFAA